MNKLKIFVSAYACEPYKGSEPGIGWNFVNEMAKYHEVHVLTRANNQESIEKDKVHENLHFHYYDLPKAIAFWKKGKRGYQLYYYLWQIFIYFNFKNFINTNNFDIIHHLTFGANWMPSLLMMSKPKTIFGPVGSEDIYKPILNSLPLKTKIKEFVRSGVKFFFYYLEPTRWMTIISADKILNHSSKYALYQYPKFLQHKVQDHVQTGLNTEEDEYKAFTSKLEKKSTDKIRLIIASELIAWKGVVISSEIFALIAKERDDVELVILGDGPQKKEMQKIFKTFNVEEKVVFKGFVSKQVLMQELYEADILLYPAYHHGLATIILQSMYAYLPIVSMCGDIISDTVESKCGVVGCGDSMQEIKENFTFKTLELINSQELRDTLAYKGREMVKNTFEWSQLVKSMLNVYEDVTNGKVKYE